MQLKPCNRCKSCNAYARYACIMSCGSKLVFYIQVLPNVFYSRLRFFSRSPSTFSRLSHRTLRKPCRSHSRFLQSPRTVAQSPRTVSPLTFQSPRTVSPLTSPSRLAQSVRSQSHRPVSPFFSRGVASLGRGVALTVRVAICRKKSTTHTPLVLDRVVVDNNSPRRRPRHHQVAGRVPRHHRLRVAGRVPRQVAGRVPRHRLRVAGRVP
jgi:hypothetical protein